MSEPTTTPENSEPETGPVLTPPPAPVTGPAAAVAEPPRPVYIQESSRLNKAAAWVGIVAGVVFIVAVICFAPRGLLGLAARLGKRREDTPHG